jgi:hypothetical protein
MSSGQMPSYTNSIRKFGHQTQWLACIDIDEFLIPMQGDSVAPLLADYERFGGLNVSWRLYGSGGHLTPPNGLVIENYKYAIPLQNYENTHTKAIVQPARTLCAGTNPHYCVFKPGYFAVSETFQPVPNAWTQHSSNKLRLNHYCCKSRADFEKKVAQPRADAAHLKGKSMDDFYRFDQLATEIDFCIERFIPMVKDELAK